MGRLVSNAAVSMSTSVVGRSSHSVYMFLDGWENRTVIQTVCFRTKYHGATQGLITVRYQYYVLFQMAENGRQSNTTSPLPENGPGDRIG